MPLWANIWKPYLGDVSRPHPSRGQKLPCRVVELAQGHQFWNSVWVEGDKQEMGKYPKNLMGFELVEVSLVCLVILLVTIFTLSECVTKAGSSHLSIAQRLHSSVYWATCCQLTESWALRTGEPTFVQNRRCGLHWTWTIGHGRDTMHLSFLFPILSIDSVAITPAMPFLNVWNKK